jgi:phage-related protein (TIGR01555 family)
MAKKHIVASFNPINKRSDIQRLKAVRDMVERDKGTTDGWANILTGIGVQGQDRRKSNQALYSMSLQEQESEDLYSADPTARRVVELLPNEALREWITFDREAEMEPISQEFERLLVKEKIQEAWVMARLHGGAGIFINDGTDAGQLDRPLDFKNLRRIQSLVVLTRWELWIRATDIERDISKPMFGKPYRYHIFPRLAFGNVAVPVHHSRIIRFDGRRLPRLAWIRNNFWSDSYLTAIKESLGDYKMSFSAVANVLQDFRVLVYKMKDLTSLLGAGQEQLVKDKLRVMSQARSVIGAQAVDADDDFLYLTATLTGVPELVGKMAERFAAETEIPHSILFNEAPGGARSMGSSGQHEETMWYDHVASQQMNYLKPRMAPLFTAVMSQKLGPTGGVIPKDATYKFNPLMQIDDAAQAKTNLENAKADEIYINGQVLTPEMVMKKRYPEIYAEEGYVEPEVEPEPVGSPPAQGGGIDPKE